MADAIMADTMADMAEEMSPEVCFYGRDACLESMLNSTRIESVPQCPADWEHDTRMCWPFSSPNTTVKLPCPTYDYLKDYLNPDQFVTRVCLENATWFVNQTFDDQPYSYYYDCLKPRESENVFEKVLRQWANKRTVFIVKIINSYRLFHGVLHFIDFFLLISSLMLCLILFLKARSRNDKYKYILLIITTVTLMCYHILDISFRSFYSSTDIIQCQVAKTIASFTSIFFCQCLFGYTVLCMYCILGIQIRRRFMTYLCVSIATTLLLVLLELFFETVVHNSRYCGFGLMQKSFHMVISAPKFFILTCVISVDSVALYGVFILRQPNLEKSGKLIGLRVSTVCVLIMNVYCILCEVTGVLLHVVADHDESDQMLHIVAHTYSTLASTRGLIFVILMCFLDPQTLGMLPFACLHMFTPKAGADPFSETVIMQQRKESIVFRHTSDKQKRKSIVSRQISVKQRTKSIISRHKSVKQRKKSISFRHESIKQRRMSNISRHEKVQSTYDNCSQQGTIERPTHQSLSSVASESDTMSLYSN